MEDNADLVNFLNFRIQEISRMIDISFPLLAEISKRYNTIACLSETIQSITMWSHYADYHKGFALEYDIRSLWLANKLPTGIFPVIYSDERFDATTYILWLFFNLCQIKLPQQDTFLPIKSALYKATQWEYEQEWRLINSADGRTNVLKEDYAEITLKPVAIYYGKNISNDNRNILHEIAVAKGIKEFYMSIDYSSPKYEMLSNPYKP